MEGHPREVIAQPAGPTAPEVWVLGSSGYGAQVAAFFGLPYCFAHFITDGRGAAEAMALYRQQFRPSAKLAAPHGALCVWALAAGTEAVAARLFTSRELWRLGRDRGVFCRCHHRRKRRRATTRRRSGCASSGCAGRRFTARPARWPRRCARWPRRTRWRRSRF